jgi:hypothetical protein
MHDILGLSAAARTEREKLVSRAGFRHCFRRILMVRMPRYCG